MTSKTRSLANLIQNTGDVKAVHLDNVPASSPGVQVYATKENLPATGLTSGDQAYVTNTSRLYISNGSGWYNVALINATPSLTIDPTGAIALSTEGTPTVITLTGTDSDNAVDGLTFSVDSDGNFAGLATLSQDSSVFTITPLSEDSATTTTSSTLTFKASDGISFGSGTSVLSLTFKVVNSNYTTLLLQADTAGTDNQVDASTNTHTITETGDVTSTAFTPYHPGGYSSYFDGTGDYLTTPTNSAFTYGTGDFTIEAWVYLSAAPTNGSPAYRYILAQGQNTTVGCGLYIQSNNFRFYTGATMVLDGTASGTQYALNQWQHVAVTRSGTTMKLFVDGVEAASGTSANSITTGTSHGLTVGRWHEIGDGGYWLGYIRDVRVVKGTAVYTSAFTPPNAPLTAIANTSLLTCHLPHITDGSTNGHTITVGGNTSTKRFSPYDYKRYTKGDYGGSVYFDGNGDHATVAASSDFDFGTGEFTVEWWQYWDGAHTGYGTAYDNNYGTNPNLTMQTANNVAQYNVYMNGTSAAFLESSAATLNTWHHYALVRYGTTVTLYRDGTSTGSMTYAGTVGNSSAIVGIGSGTLTNNYTIKGYFSDFRVVKGTAVYTSTFTPPTARLTAISGTSLLTCTNKNDIWDAGGREAQITKTGDAAASNTQRKFTSSDAIYLDGSGDNITMSDLEMGSGDLTFEFWMYQDIAQSNTFRCVLGASTYGGGIPFTLYTYGSNVAIWLSNSGGPHINAAFTATTWQHVAVVRNSGTWKLYVDGTSGGSSTTGGTYNFAATADFRFGENLAGSYDWKGYIQNARFTKGLARYTSNFTPATSEFGG